MDVTNAVLYPGGESTADTLKQPKGVTKETQVKQPKGVTNEAKPTPWVSAPITRSYIEIGFPSCRTTTAMSSDKYCAYSCCATCSRTVVSTNARTSFE